MSDLLKLPNDQWIDARAVSAIVVLVDDAHGHRVVIHTFQESATGSGPASSPHTLLRFGSEDEARTFAADFGAQVNSARRSQP